MRDFFLRRKMDPEGFIPITLIASFHRIQALTTNVALVIEAIQESDKLEIVDGYKVGSRFLQTNLFFGTIITHFCKCLLECLNLCKIDKKVSLAP